ncbi:Uncharacterised protein [Mycobacterium tuberculosis]|nr:Uncharacterised protein [Mycobacterium tuberculosis]
MNRVAWVRPYALASASTAIREICKSTRRRTASTSMLASAWARFGTGGSALGSLKSRSLPHTPIVRIRASRADVAAE